MATPKPRKRRFVVSIVGVVLVILGVLWITVIFPSLDKVPTSYERSYYFVGNFTVVNPATQSMDFFPIAQTLAQRANGTQDGALLIHEKRIVLRTDTNPPTDISSIYGDESTLAIDAHTLKFMTNVDERNRTGYWGPPRGLGKDKSSFDLWNEGAHAALPARYVRDEEFRGMKVVLFRIDEGNITIINPQTQLPLMMSTTINLWIDPKTGTVVDQDSTTTTSMNIAGNIVPLQISNVRYAESTIVDLMGVAKDAARMLLLFTTVIPWVLIGVGIVLFIIDTTFIGRRRRSAA
jgi:hydrogenase maturation factor